MHLKIVEKQKLESMSYEAYVNIDYIRFAHAMSDQWFSVNPRARSCRLFSQISSLGSRSCKLSI